MVPAARSFLLMIVLGAAMAASAQQGTIEVTCFPSIGLADGNSLVTITAEVRDNTGSPARNGTQVVFETDKGLFRSRNSVETQNGLARIQMVAPSVAGTAKVRASAFSLQAFGSIEIEFVSDRSLLSSAKEYVEIVSNNSVSYSPQFRLVEANSANGGVTVKYRDVTIKADQAQLVPGSFEVRARNAEVSIGKVSQRFKEVYLKLNQWKGWGITVEETETFSVTTVGPMAGFSKIAVPSLKTVAIDRTGVKPVEGQSMRQLNLTDLSESVSTVESKKAVVFPSRGIQFHKASIKVNGQSVVSLPMFQLDTRRSSPVVTEQFLDVSNNSVALNYPHYFDLRPGFTSLARLRYGNRLSTGAGTVGGTYVDLESKWNKGADMEGGLALTGLNRSDWSASLQQFWQTGSRTIVSAQLDLPAHRSLFSSISFNQRLPAANFSANAQHGTSLAGERLKSEQYSMNLASDPVPFGKSPFSLTYGLNANYRKLSGASSLRQSTLGSELRLDMRPVRLNAGTTFTGSVSIGALAGEGTQTPWTQVANIGITTAPNQSLFAQFGYEFVRDGFSEEFLGSHRLTTEVSYRSGRLSLGGYLSQSIDVDRANINAHMNYRFGPAWRLSYSAFADRFEGDLFLDQTLILGYKLGFREIGLSYSTRTKRIGFELLGTSFD